MTYPNTEYDIGGRNNGAPTKTIAQYQSITSTFAEQFPRQGRGCRLRHVAEQLEHPEHGPERVDRPATYWSNQDTAVTLGDNPYHSMKLGDEFMFTRDTMVKSGTVDILAAFKYLARRAW